MQFTYMQFTYLTKPLNQNKMIPKEKAKELVYEMSLATDEYGYINTNVHRHKQCAIIAVDEILNNDGFTQFDIYLTEYWQQVKQEIINL